MSSSGCDWAAAAVGASCSFVFSFCTCAVVLSFASVVSAAGVVVDVAVESCALVGFSCVTAPSVLVLGGERPARPRP